LSGAGIRINAFGLTQGVGKDKKTYHELTPFAPGGALPSLHEERGDSRN